MLAISSDYELKEGFGTLMSHYAMMYSIYLDTGIKPISLNFENTKTTTAMKHFNSFCNEPILYHGDIFENYSKIFHIVDVAYPDTPKDNWIIGDFSNMTYNQIIDILQDEKVQKKHILCLWSLNHKFNIKYLDKIKNYLYKFRPGILNYSKLQLPNTDKQIIGVCVRNEYKNSSHPHIQLSMKYYEDAMNKFDTNKSKFLIFSDDIDESKKIFKIYEKDYDIEYTNKMQSGIGLCAMSMCDHIINANSSFSYWASILNKNENTKIICHQDFINPEKQPILAKIMNKNWYPENWIALDS